MDRDWKPSIVRLQDRKEEQKQGNGIKINSEKFNIPNSYTHHIHKKTEVENHNFFYQQMLVVSFC